MAVEHAEHHDCRRRPRSLRYYNGHTVLTVSFTIERGCPAACGPQWFGQSTLLKMLGLRPGPAKSLSSVILSILRTAT
jgi:hypothetical protein